MPFEPFDFVVTTTAQVILGYNPYRTGWTLTNRSGAIVYFGYSASVTATTGLKHSGSPILANNGRAKANDRDDDPKLAIWVIVASGTATVNAHESVR